MATARKGLMKLNNTRRLTFKRRPTLPWLDNVMPDSTLADNGIATTAYGK